MADKKTRELLRHNKHGPSLQLWLNKSSLNGATGMALAQNTTVHTVSVFVESDFMQNSHEELMFLFDEIGRLPLKNLFIYSFGQNFDVFPIKLLIHVFDYAEHLQVLTMYFVELGGHAKYFNTFGEVLRDHRHLKEFRLENCRLPDNVLNTLAFDQFVTTVTALPKLERLDLLATEMGALGLLTPPGLRQIARCKTLNSLNLMNFPFTNVHITALRDAVNSNENLTELSISCDPEFCTNLAPFISTNETLETLKIKVEQLNDEKFIHRIAVALKDNKTITRFELKGEKDNRMSKKNLQDFIDVLEKNKNIVLDVNFWDNDLKKQAQHYRSLNQTNRLKFEAHEKEQEMIKRAATEKDDIVSGDARSLVQALSLVGDDMDTLHRFLCGTRICQ